MAKKTSRSASRIRTSTQRGGNYFLNVGGERIGGMAEVMNVNDPIAPVQGASPHTFATPLFMQGGATKKRVSKKSKKSSKKSSKKASKKVSKKLSKKNNKKRMQKGGNAEVAYNGNGMESVFHDNMMQRDFSCKTPEWNPSCI